MLVMNIEALARAAYQAYGEVLDFKNYRGDRIPEWEQLPPKMRQAWCAAVLKGVEINETTKRVDLSLSDGQKISVAVKPARIRQREINFRAHYTLDGSEHLHDRATLAQAMASIPFALEPTDWFVQELDRPDYPGVGRILAGTRDMFV